MPEFHMNDSESPAFQALDSFTRGYITALFFTEETPNTVRDAESLYPSARIWEPESDSSLPGDVGFDDIAPSTLARIISDCAKFQAIARCDLVRAENRGRDLEHCGHDFWLTRNGHGAGFWDRRELEDNSADYERLTQIMVAAGHDSAAWHAALKERNALSEKSLGARLTRHCKQFGECDVYLGDDGRVYIMGTES